MKKVLQLYGLYDFTDFRLVRNMKNSLKVFLTELKAFGEANDIPNISFHTGEILQFFLRISEAKNIFEIGCANGFSTIFLADAVSEVHGKVVTCDVSHPSFEQAKINVEKAGLSECVDFRFGDALSALAESEQFDFVFIDGQKNRTHEFFLLAKQHLAPKGIIIIDDTKKFPEKMAEFSRLRDQEKEFVFCDIPVDGDDSLTVAF